jgi:hypothetical protein
MVVARAMANRDAADDLRDACMSVALDLGGWQDRSSSSLRGRKSRRSQGTNSTN